MHFLSFPSPSQPLGHKHHGQSKREREGKRGRGEREREREGERREREWERENIDSEICIFRAERRSVDEVLAV